MEQQSRYSENSSAKPAVMGGMMVAQKVLEIWHQKAGENYDSSSPSAAAPLGRLIDYMMNPANKLTDRWNTFSDYVEEGAGPSEQSMVISAILSTGNPQEDQALKNWKWSTDDQNKVVDTMTAQADQQTAYKALGSYAYNGQLLPIKVAASMAVKYITKIS